MKHLKCLALVCTLLLANYLGFSQSGFSWNAEIASEGVTLTNFTRSATTPCNGTNSWRTSAFRSSITNMWRSPHVNFGSASLVTVDFNYKVVVAAGSGTWTISVDLYNSGTLVVALGTITGSASTSGSGCTAGSKFKFLSPPVFVPLEVRFTVTTTNSTVNAGSYVQLDNVFSYFDALASVKGDSGLSQPSYTTGTRNITRPGTDVYGDVYVTKSTQSAVFCPGISDPDAPIPICSITSLNALHEVKIIDKTTGDVTYGVLQSFTIPYQTATYEKAYTSVQFESATSYYVHYFTIPTVESSGTKLYWKTYEVAQP